MTRDDRLLWYEMADALWLEAHRSAAAGDAGHGAGDRPAPPPARGRPPATGPPSPATGPDAMPDAPVSSRPAAEHPWPDLETPGPAPPDAAATGHDPWRTVPGAAGDPGDAGLGIIGSVPVEVPPCPDKRALGKAFRVFKRTVEVPDGERDLDEEATAERAVQERLWLPVRTPATERWLDLDVVIDDSPLSGLHRDRFDALIDAVRVVCAFRRIRVHHLDTAAADLRLRPAKPIGAAGPVPGLVRSGDPRRRLVMVLSDGAGRAWYDGRLAPLLARVADAAPTVVVNPLPVRQWRRTGTRPVPARLTAPGPAVPNRRLDAVPAYERDVPAVPVPMVELAADPLTWWGRFVAGDRRHLDGAVVWCAFSETDDAHEPAVPAPGGPGETPAELVSRFRAIASPEAFQLLTNLAALPLSLPLMRLVQAATLPSSRPSDLAEALGSGLIRRVAADPPDPRAIAVTHDFVAGVREALLAGGRRSQTAWVMMSLLDRLTGAAAVLAPLRELLISPETAPVPRVAAASAPIVSPFVTGMRSLGAAYREPAVRLQAILDDSALITQGNQPLATDDHVSGEDVMQSSGEAVDALKTPVHLQRNARPPLITSDLIAPGVSVSIRSVPPAADRDPNEPPPVWGNVPPRNIQFTGREELLEELHTLLSEGMTAVLPHALQGMGGVGKSQLAVEYVYRHMRDYDLIWWVPAEGEGQIRQSLVELAAELDLPVVREVNIAVPAVLEALRVGRPFRNWLLIFDNAEDLTDVREFFPKDGPGKILVTSRNPAWTGVARTVEVNVFERRESIELLRVRDPDLADEPADRLAEALGDLPLAIEQAAAWLAETAMTVDEYLRLLQEKTEALLAQHTSSSDYAVPVAAAWNVSLERLHSGNRPALRLLQMCAFFAPEPISLRVLSGARNLEGPAELLEALSDTIQLGRAIRAINQYALAKISHRHNTIMLHRLVQRVLRSQLDEEETAEYRHCAHLLLANADPNNTSSPEHWPTYAALVPHIRFSGLVRSTDKWARSLVLNTMDFLFRWGDYEGSRKLAEEAVDTWAEMLGDDDDQKLEAQLTRGRALYAVGLYREAYESNQNARDILVAKYGEDHERSLVAKGYVSNGQRLLGDFAGSLETGRRVFETARQRFGPDDPVTLTHAYFYGISLRLSGQPEVAEQLDRDTHARQVRVLGENHLHTISTMAGLGFDVMESGRYLEAREIIRQNLARMRAKYGENHPGTTGNISALSVAERKAGDHETALALSAEALALNRARYGDEGPGYSSVALNHAINLRQAGDIPQSIGAGQEVAKQHEIIYGVPHPSTLAAKVNVAVSLRLAGRIEEALHLEDEILPALADALGRDHPWSIIGDINHASSLSAHGDVEDAAELGRAAYERARRVNGEDHPTTLAAMLNLALDLRALGGEGEAEAGPLFADVLVRYRRTLGATHPATTAAERSTRADCDIYTIPL